MKQPKYQLLQVVWTMHDNVPTDAFIEGILIDASTILKDNSREAVSFKYIFDSTDNKAYKVDESKVFPTKQDLINSL